uniref:Immunoglobulin domain-containing protein n=1 Tax=Laticauda laticaudata TaxID=8630 RepID=A0A8C5RJT0_LATLA
VAISPLEKLFLLPLLKRKVTGLMDGSVSIKCFYPPTSVNIHSRKYWCKESTRHCYTFISSNGFVIKDYKNRASITDFPENGMFIIEISDLKSNDVGLYRCGIGLNDYGLSFKIKLEVTQGTYRTVELNPGHTSCCLLLAHAANTVQFPNIPQLSTDRTLAR